MTPVISSLSTTATTGTGSASPAPMNWATYIFHRDRLNGGVGDTLAYRAEGSGAPNPLIGAVQETEANRFAANLLMPNRLIAKLADDGVTDPAEVAARLNVSEDAIRIKLGVPPKEPAQTLFG
jgi:hypothetical protein